MVASWRGDKLSLHCRKDLEYFKCASQPQCLREDSISFFVFYQKGSHQAKFCSCALYHGLWQGLTFLFKQLLCIAPYTCRLDVFELQQAG